MRRKFISKKVSKSAAFLLAASLIAVCVGQRAKAVPVSDTPAAAEATEQDQKSVV